MPQLTLFGFNQSVHTHTHTHTNSLYVCMCIYSSHERTPEELELVFEELVHIAALSHLSTSIKRELSSIIVFEAHAQAGTICEYN